MEMGRSEPKASSSQSSTVSLRRVHEVGGDIFKPSGGSLAVSSGASASDSLTLETVMWKLQTILEIVSNTAQESIRDRRELGRLSIWLQQLVQDAEMTGGISMQTLQLVQMTELSLQNIQGTILEIIAGLTESEPSTTGRGSPINLQDVSVSMENPESAKQDSLCALYQEDIGSHVAAAALRSSGGTDTPVKRQSSWTSSEDRCGMKS